MTGPDMIYQWKVEFDVIASGAAPGFEDSEIYILLNKAYDSLILELYKNKDWLSLQTISDSVACILSETSYIVPSLFWLYIDSYSLMTRASILSTGFIQNLNTSDYTIVSNKLVSPENFLKYRQTVFNSNEIIKNPYVHLIKNIISIIVDIYTTLKGVVITFVRKPLLISNNQSCELQESFHKTIVTIAVDLAKQSISIKEPKKQ